MGIIEIYLAVGVVVAIFLLIGIFSDNFDEMFEELTDDMTLPISWKIFITFITVFIWPYTLYRFYTIMKEEEE